MENSTAPIETISSPVEPGEDPLFSGSSALDSEDLIDLPDGRGFDLLSSAAITRANPTQVIVLAGGSGSGKTTLLASMYEKFQKSPFAGYIFAGSRTLPGLERRCYLARIASGRSEPDTERTKGAENTLLHLKVRKQDLTRPSQDLLFTDLGGERFRLAKDSTTECKRLKFLLRADHFALLIDGAMLARVEKRQEACVFARSLLRSCLDAEMLGAHSYVDVLFTKWDLIRPKMEEHRIKDFLEGIQTQFKDRFAGRVARLRFFRIAARPTEDPPLPFAYNLEKFFPSWVEDSPRRNYFKSEFSYDLDSLREIERFGMQSTPTKET
jgi:hypothetical protein